MVLFLYDCSICEYFNSYSNPCLQYENPWTVPNFLCVCRIVLAPVLAHLIIQQHFHLSLALFMLAGATDLVIHTKNVLHNLFVDKTRIFSNVTVKKKRSVCHVVL